LHAVGLAPARNGAFPGVSGRGATPESWTDSGVCICCEEPGFLPLATCAEPRTKCEFALGNAQVVGASGAETAACLVGLTCMFTQLKAAAGTLVEGRRWAVRSSHDR